MQKKGIATCSTVLLNDLKRVNEKLVLLKERERMLFTRKIYRLQFFPKWCITRNPTKSEEPSKLLYHHWKWPKLLKPIKKSFYLRTQISYINGSRPCSICLWMMMTALEGNGTNEPCKQVQIGANTGSVNVINLLLLFCWLCFLLQRWCCYLLYTRSNPSGLTAPCRDKNNIKLSCVKW